jgi:hypothetical protein
LQNAQSGMYLSTPVVENQTNGANVFVWRSAEQPESRWKLHTVSNGDGTAYSVKNAAFGRFLSVAGASLASGANVHLWSSPGKQESQWEFISEGSCHDAVEGDICYNDTIWAKDYAINTRPQWYPGLTNESSFSDFQAHLHYCYWGRCPMPCASTSQFNCQMVGRFWGGATSCQDAAEGSTCLQDVTWAMEHGIHLHPEWYPSLSEHSSFREFQFRLFQGQQSGLDPSHGCSEPCCHDTLPGELCHEDVAWARSYGINLPEFSDVYPPSLTNESDFAEFQAYLHLCYPQRCPEPCASTELAASQHSVGSDCPDVRDFV